MISRAWIVLCVYGAAISVQGLHAQALDTLVLSLQDARAMATTSNSELLAAAQRVRAAGGDVRASRVPRFNPEATFESHSPGAGFGSRYEAALGIEVELAGQQGARSRTADAGYAASARRFEDDARRVLTDVSLAYAALAAAERRLILVEQIGSLNADLNAAVRTQLAEGEVSALEANLAAIETARARASVLEARSDRSAASLALARILGMDELEPIRTAGAEEVEALAVSRSDLDALVQAALLARPDLRAVENEVERTRHRVSLTRRETLPNLRIAALATRDDPVADTRFGIGLGLSLPLFNRGQGVVDRSRAELSEVEHTRAAVELRVRTEVEAALTRYESAQEAVSILETELLGPIRENHSLLEVAYTEGLIDIATLLLLRNQLLDAELDYWDAWERREQARTQLESATGRILEGVILNFGSER